MGKNAAIGFGGFMIVISSISLFFKRYLLYVWTHFLKRPFDEFNSIVKDKLGTNTPCTRSGPQTHPASMSADKREELLLEVYKATYEAQAVEPDSFCMFVKKFFMDSFCCQPYQQDVNKTINIQPYDDDYIRWREESTSTIVHPLYKTPKRSEATFPLMGDLECYVPDPHDETWMDKFSLGIWEGNHTIIDPNHKPDEKAPGMDEAESYYYFERTENWMRVKYKQIVRLKKATTTIKTVEESINAIADTEFTQTVSKPVKGYSFEMHLPEGFSFLRNVKIGSTALFNALPDFDEIEKSDFYERKFHSDQWLKVHIRKWLMPGLAFSVRWVKK